MIPKRMVFFWGNERMSWLRYMTLYSFRKYNPDWEMALYVCPMGNVQSKTWVGPEKQDFFTYSGLDYMPKVKNLGVEVLKYEVSQNIVDSIGPSHKSNFFKWNAMWTSGGWYSDMDILWTRPMNDVYEWLKNVNTVLAWNGSYFSIGLLASSPGNDFFHGVYDNGFKTATMKEYQSAGVLNIYNFLKNLRNKDPSVCSDIAPGDYYGMMNRFFPKLKTYSLPMNLVYPWSYREMDKVFHRCLKTPPGTIGIHWYAGCALAQEYNCKLTELNFRQDNNTLRTPLQDVLEYNHVDLGNQFHWFDSRLKDATKWCSNVVEFGSMFCKRLRQASALVKDRIGLEVSKEYCYKAVAESGCTVINGDIREFEKYIHPSKNDCVLIIDVIEHLSKKDGMNLIERCRNFFKKIVIATPEGYIRQDNDPTGLGQNTWQTHRSGWTLEELKTLGFTGEVYPKYTGETGYVFATWVKNSIT